MTIITRSEFARRCGLTPGAITHAVRGHRIPSVGGNIDLDDPAIVAFLELRKNTAKAAGKNGVGRPVEGGGFVPGGSAPSPTLTPITPDAIEPAADEFAGMNLAERQKWSAAKLTEERFREKRLQNRIAEGLAHEDVVVRRAFSLLVSAQEESLREIDGPLADEIVSAIEAGKGKTEVAAIIHDRIDLAMRSTYAALDRALERLRPGAGDA